MSDSKHSGDKRREEPSSTGMAVDDIYFVLFRQKWIILAGTALGILAAGALLILKPAQYQSEAELLIKYVVDVRSPTPKATDDGSVTKSPDAGGVGIINTEIKILTSLDTVQQVVSTLGAETILAKAGGGSDTNSAARLILKNLATEPPTKDSVISITYQHPDKDVARAILGQLIAAYLKKHVDMHQPVGIYGDVLNGETERLKNDLANTEKQLREAKQKAGVISLDEAKKGLSDQISKIKEELVTTEADLAEHRTVLKEAHALPSPTDTNNATAGLSADDVREYRNACARLNSLLQKEQEDINKYPDTSPFMQQTRQLIIEAEQHKMQLEQANPRLASIVVAPVAQGAPQADSALDLAAESLIVKKLESKTNALNMELASVQADAERIELMEAPIVELERRKESQENNLRYFLSSMEQNRINAELGTGSGTDGISIVQAPSPAAKMHSKKFKKFLGMALAGGFFGGLGLAFFIEMIVDRSVRRPGVIEKKLRLPLYVSIPDFTPNGKQRPAIAAPTNGVEPLLLRNGDDGETLAVATTNGHAAANGAEEIPPWDRRHAMHRFYEGLRDRLIVNFEIKNLTHKPKLVAVTSCNRGAGVSTIAAGLAASLSETGDGNVLLVDMNYEEGMAQHFRLGRPGCGLDDALESETMNNAQVSGNLYVAAERVGDDKLPRVLPRRFASLMPKLKASDYDYIIFDMPAVSQTSITPRLAGLMDMVLLVIESEKTSQDVVKRVSALLAESKANVSTVLNKARNYIPAQLHQEFLDGN